jgi:hypothetical protein
MDSRADLALRLRQETTMHANDNAPPRTAPLIGVIRDDGRVERLNVVQLLRIPAQVLALFTRR